MNKLTKLKIEKTSELTKQEKIKEKLFGKKLPSLEKKLLELNKENNDLVNELIKTRKIIVSLEEKLNICETKELYNTLNNDKVK